MAKQLTGCLIKPVSTLKPCREYAQGAQCALAMLKVHNPFYLSADPGNAQSQGWSDAWQYQNSVYAVEAENTADVAAAVDFARNHHLRLVIKGTGHDYLGRSNAANSLLI
ncbi:FAD-binding protein [Legionella spiritensis]|uniref:FAD linked oxidase n=1 Tax=Legionella spiritensis TaxID=452 RepID=A0A0W0YX66_LEGSP|nr:FAD linked oxidase [Legionella spiritensis]SNV44856.1 FAD linked oxidase [Legionella spiritensis]